MNCIHRSTECVRLKHMNPWVTSTGPARHASGEILLCSLIGALCLNSHACVTEDRFFRLDNECIDRKKPKVEYAKLSRKNPYTRQDRMALLNRKLLHSEVFKSHFPFKSIFPPLPVIRARSTHSSFRPSKN